MLRMNWSRQSIPFPPDSKWKISSAFPTFVRRWRKIYGNFLPDVYLSFMHGTAWMMPPFFIRTWEIFSLPTPEWQCAWSEFVNTRKKNVFEAEMEKGASHRLKNRFKSVIGLMYVSSEFLLFIGQLQRSQRATHIQRDIRYVTQTRPASSCSQSVCLSLSHPILRFHSARYFSGFEAFKPESHSKSAKRWGKIKAWDGGNHRKGISNRHKK